MIAAQTNDPDQIAPAMPDPATLEVPDINDIRRDSPAFAPAESPAPREARRALHPDFGPLALPALLAATRVMRGAAVKRG